MKNRTTAVVAFGGNAITREFEEGNITQQFANTRRSLLGVLELIKRDYNIAITHGNGPQVGNALIRVEESRHLVPPLPMGIIVADLQGGMGYMIQQSLQNKLQKQGLDRDVSTLLTQVLVDRNDPSVQNPTKFVGPFLAEENVESIRKERGWIIKYDNGRGYRRVVPSPIPLEIIEKNIIQKLVHSGVILICTGGGGIPVCRERDGSLEGVDAVIDKDLASAVLAKTLRAEELYIMTAIEKVALNYRQPNEILLDKMTVSEAKTYLEEGQFPAGSMGPKIKAAIDFLESGGKKVLIGQTDKMTDIVEGNSGTVITL